VASLKSRRMENGRGGEKERDGRVNNSGRENKEFLVDNGDDVGMNEKGRLRNIAAQKRGGGRGEIDDAYLPGRGGGRGRTQPLKNIAEPTGGGFKVEKDPAQMFRCVKNLRRT